MAELGQTTDPQELIPGQPATVETGVNQLRAFGERLTTVGENLRRVDVEGWTGRASTAFHNKWSNEPPRWITGGDALDGAAQALTGHADTVRWAQTQAAEAIQLWAQGEAATANAAGAGTDPGDPLRQQARELLERARGQVRQTADDTATTITNLAQQQQSLARKTRSIQLAQNDQSMPTEATIQWDPDGPVTRLKPGVTYEALEEHRIRMPREWIESYDSRTRTMRLRNGARIRFVDDLTVW